MVWYIINLKKKHTKKISMHHEYIKRKTITNYRSERTFWNPKWICINKQKIIYTSVQIIRMLIRITSYLKSEEKHEISKFNLFCCCWSDYQLNFEEKKNRILNVTNLFIIIIHATTVDKLVEKDNDVSSFHGHFLCISSGMILIESRRKLRRTLKIRKLREIVIKCFKLQRIMERT